MKYGDVMRGKNSNATGGNEALNGKSRVECGVIGKQKEVWKEWRKDGT